MHLIATGLVPTEPEQSIGDLDGGRARWWDVFLAAIVFIYFCIRSMRIGRIVQHPGPKTTDPRPDTYDRLQTQNPH